MWDHLEKVFKGYAEPYNADTKFFVVVVVKISGMLHDVHFHLQNMLGAAFPYHKSITVRGTSLKS